jgi:SAM-dependent methyltransferase
MGLGFATPFLGSYRGEVDRLAALMPSSQGALVWPPTGPVMTALVEPEHLPLPDNSVDRLLAVHCVEIAERVRPLLREMWRVLSPEGRLLMVVPNRRGVWARVDTTPFGQGQPYSRAQLERLLGEALFTPVDWTGALHFPPIDRPLLLRSSSALERFGLRISPAFSGVIVVEAKKELIAPIGKAARARSLRQLMPVRIGGSARSEAPPSCTSPEGESSDGADQQPAPSRRSAPPQP